jgi:xanthine/uracil/vitamin C permease (AzgA family)
MSLFEDKKEAAAGCGFLGCFSGIVGYILIAVFFSLVIPGLVLISIIMAFIFGIEINGTKYDPDLFPPALREVEVPAEQPQEEPSYDERAD